MHIEEFPADIPAGAAEVDRHDGTATGWTGDDAVLKMGATVIENIGWKLLALAIAVVLWALVAANPSFKSRHGAAGIQESGGRARDQLGSL